MLWTIARYKSKELKKSKKHAYPMKKMTLRGIDRTLYISNKS